MSDFPLPLEGGCRCNALRYRVSAAPLFGVACHCTDCQKMTASAFSLGLAVPRAGFALTRGAPRRVDKTADSGATSTRHLCPECLVWTHTTTTSSPDAVVVRPSSLDDRAWFRPVGQIYLRSAHRWAVMPLPLGWAAEFDGTTALQAAWSASDIRPGQRH
jgi:hypothetical protein